MFSCSLFAYLGIYILIFTLTTLVNGEWGDSRYRRNGKNYNLPNRYRRSYSPNLRSRDSYGYDGRNVYDGRRGRRLLEDEKENDEQTTKRRLFDFKGMLKNAASVAASVVAKGTGKELLNRFTENPKVMETITGVVDTFSEKPDPINAVATVMGAVNQLRETPKLKHKTNIVAPKAGSGKDIRADDDDGDDDGDDAEGANEPRETTNDSTTTPKPKAKNDENEGPTGDESSETAEVSKPAPKAKGKKIVKRNAGFGNNQNRANDEKYEDYNPIERAGSGNSEEHPEPPNDDDGDDAEGTEEQRETTKVSAAASKAKAKIGKKGQTPKGSTIQSSRRNEEEEYKDDNPVGRTGSGNSEEPPESQEPEDEKDIDEEDEEDDEEEEGVNGNQ